jgi:SAM-dependent methyltransferase
MVDENGAQLAADYLGYVSDISTTRWATDFRRTGSVEIAEALCIKNTIPNVSAAVFRRDALATVLFDHLNEMVAYRNASDWLCYLRLLSQGGAVAFTAHALNNHRRHSTSITLAAPNLRHLEEIVSMQDLAATIVPIPPETRAIAIRYRRTVADQFGIPVDLIPSNGLDDDAWLELLRFAAAGDEARIDGRSLPSMPDTELQVRTVGHAGPDAMQEAWDFTAQCLARFRASPDFGDPRKVLLDFGTGWGRVARCFLRDIPAEQLMGADVDDDLLAVCRATFPGPRFLRCGVMPPLGLEDETVDFVVSYSVFSHLSETACRAWIAEFARILKPGGMVALTTRGRWFFDHAASCPGTDPYARALSRMFPDFVAAKARYDRGEFVHSNAPGVTGGGVLDNGSYGETFIPERFAREVLGCILPLTAFHTGEGHPILFFEKPVEAR